MASASGDVVAIMLRNSPNAVLAMLAAVKCGAVAGMLNYHQRGDVLAHSLGLLDAKVLIAETDLVSAVAECGAAGATDNTLTVEDLERFAVSAHRQPGVGVGGAGQGHRVLHLHLRHHRCPKASVMTHYRWLQGAGRRSAAWACGLESSDTVYSCLPLYHNNALTVAVSSVISSGATLALGKSFSASRFWDEVIANDATAFIYIGEICRYLLNQPAKPTDRAHKVRRDRRQRAAAGDLGRIHRSGSTSRGSVEFYAASEGNTAFINIFNMPRTTGISPMPLAYVEYDPDTGAPVRDENGRVRRVPAASPACCSARSTRLQPFDGYTDKEASEKKLVRNAFREGDCWFNTGDVMSPQGMGHAAFVDRLGDTFRWKGENVATTQVEAAVASDAAVEECTVYGVEVPGTGGRAGMAAVKLRDGAEFDGKSLARTVYDQLPAYALPLFVRVVGVAGAHRDVQEPQGGAARAGIRTRRRGPAVRAGRPRRGVRPVLRRLSRRSGCR